MEDEETHLKWFPAELLEHIFSYLPGPHLAMASIMCRDWYLLSTQPKLWEALAEAEFGITAEQLPDNSQHWKDVFADAYSAQNTFRSGQYKLLSLQAHSRAITTLTTVPPVLSLTPNHESSSGSEQNDPASPSWDQSQPSSSSLDQDPESSAASGNSSTNGDSGTTWSTDRIKRSLLAGPGMKDGFPWIATGSLDQSVKLWDPTSGQLLASLNGSGGSIHCLATHSIVHDHPQDVPGDSSINFTGLHDHPRPETTLLAAGAGRVVRLWAIQPNPDLELVKNSSLPSANEALSTTLMATHRAHSGPVLGLSFYKTPIENDLDDVLGPDGEPLDGEHDENDGPAPQGMWLGGPPPPAPGPPETPTATPHGGQAALDESLRLLSGSFDRTLRRWDVVSGDPGPTLQSPTAALVTVVASDKWIAAVGADGIVYSWDTSKIRDSLTHTHSFKGHEGIVSAAALLPPLPSHPSAPSLLVTGASRIRVWNLDAGSSVAKLKSHSDSILCLAHSDDYLVSGSRDSTIVVWSRPHLTAAALWTGSYGSRKHHVEAHAKLHVLRGHKSGVQCVAVQRHHIVSGSEDTTIRVWDADTGLPLFLIPTEAAPVLSLKLLPNFRIIAGLGNGSLRIYDFRGDPQQAGVAGRAEPTPEQLQSFPTVSSLLTTRSRTTSLASVKEETLELNPEQQAAIILAANMTRRNSMASARRPSLSSYAAHRGTRRGSVISVGASSGIFPSSSMYPMPSSHQSMALATASTTTLPQHVLLHSVSSTTLPGPPSPSAMNRPRRASLVTINSSQGPMLLNPSHMTPLLEEPGALLTSPQPQMPLSPYSNNSSDLGCVSHCSDDDMVSTGSLTSVSSYSSASSSDSSLSSAGSFDSGSSTSSSPGVLGNSGLIDDSDGTESS